ncbi:MAG TPA: hypothetical protein VHB77_11225 [Planctomycetaceae bacterium]|nr:hypothetical protein [Planctomycetaceae bacterium]
MPAPASLTPTPRRKLSLRKRIGFNIVLFVLVLACVEGISLLALAMRFGGWAEAAHDLDAALRADIHASPHEVPEDVLHPYLGWVRRPPSPRKADYGKVNDWGFYDPHSPFHRRSPDKLIIAVMGGSVAEELGRHVGSLERAVRESPRWAHRKIEFVHLALEGYKQPQQLATINYLLALGAQFDVVVNLDGYNEMVLPGVENVPHHVYPAFPRGWHARVTETSDLTTLRQIGRIVYRREQIRDTARFARQSLLAWSPTVCLGAMCYERALEDQLLTEQVQLGTEEASTTYAATGPTQKFGSDADLEEFCADLWKRASLQLDEVCRANGIVYIHCLQPNQYVADSKPMNAAEQETAIDAGHPGRRFVEGGYPLLRQRGAELRDRGVRFFDLTTIFADHPEATYRDNCCHMNQHGYELIGARIGEIVRAELDK